MGCGCGCFPDRKKDDEFTSLASKPLLKTPSSLNTSAFPSEAVSFKCDGSCNYNDCKHIQRVIDALKYYHSIDVIKHQKELIMFVTQKYTAIHNDWHHILMVHEYDIKNIHNILLKKHQVPPCKIYKCMMLQRNQLDFDNDIVNFDVDNDPIANIEITYWIRTLDNIHCYIMHGYDYAYLTDINNTNNNNITEEKKDLELEGNQDFYITSPVNTIEKFDDFSDETFAELKQHIITKKNYLVKMNAAERSPCKYNICICLPQNTDKKIEEIKQSQTSQSVPLKPLMEAKLSSQRPQSMKKIDNNIGLRFYYWNHYKNRDTYVEKKYESLKEEMLNNAIYKVNKDQFEVGKRITEKVFDTQYSRTLKARFIKDRHYGINKGDPIDIRHLGAVVLYCNHDKLASGLLRTFAGQRTNEQLFSIKQRHQEFRNWSKLLREAIDYFGMDATEIGSCYVGCKNVIIPTVSIRLRAPISTSKHLCVVLRFLNDMNDGMILELNSNEYHSSTYDMKGFRCHWLSNFAGENEVVFMGGKHTMKICSIRNVSLVYNYKKYCNALYYFDLMLMGVEIPNDKMCEITRNDYELLNYIITKQLTINSKKESLLSESNSNNSNKSKEISVQYMESMFEYYSNEKQTIIIDLLLVNKYYKIFKELIISERINNIILFNQLGLLFPNLSDIGILAFTDECKIDLFEMFHEIAKKHSKHIQKIQIQCKHKRDGGSWLSNAWNENIEFKFYTQKFKAKFSCNDDFDQLVLSKKKKMKVQKSKTVNFGESVSIS